jgi:spermidine synthase
VSPLLITTLCSAGRPVGRAAGAISAAGTIGSLAGTFAATHWLVPAFGCRLAMTIAGAALVLASLVLGGGGHRAGSVALVAVVVALGVPRGPLRPAPSGRELLAERESRTQFLQVHRQASGNGPGRTLLVINEGLDSFHSLAVEGSRLCGGAYYDWHALAPFLAGDGDRPTGLRALSIGDAAGSLRAVYAAVHPGAQVDAVDIDSAPMELGDRWFPGPKAEGQRAVLDGRVFLQRATARWHVIHVDAYAHQVYVPAHLASREFFAAAHARLEPGGVLACNVGALHDQDPVLKAIGTTMAAEFGQARALLIPGSRNALLVARREAPLRPERLANAPRPADLSAADAASWSRVIEFGQAPASWREVGNGELVLVDDQPVLDQLLANSYLDIADAAALTECGGPQQVAGAEAQAYQAAAQRDWIGSLRALASSSAPSAYLREIGGDARWALRQLGSAAAEYTAALALVVEPEARARLERKLVDVRADRQPILAAQQLARRNGLYQLGLCCLGVIAALLGRRWLDAAASVRAA